MDYMDEDERERLTDKWHKMVAKYEGKKVVSKRDRIIGTVERIGIVKGDTYTVKEFHVYLGVLPLFILEETGTKMWRPDNFKLLDN